MTNSEPQITDADRAAADGVLSALSLGSRSADDCAFMIANAMAHEREAVRKRIEAADALAEIVDDKLEHGDCSAPHGGPCSCGMKHIIPALAAYRAACKTETNNENRD